MEIKNYDQTKHAQSQKENFNDELSSDYNEGSTTNPREEQQLQILTRYEDLEIPSVLLRDVESYENKGWRDQNAKVSDYFNYGYNEEMWGKYSKYTVAKLLNLNKAIKENRVHLPNSKALIKYIFNLPADYGGTGEILDEQKYENLNFFEFKAGKNKAIPVIEIRQGSVCVPLESRNENLNINYNAITNVNNFSSINSNISTGPQNFPSYSNPQPPGQFPHPYPFPFLYRPPAIPGMDMFMPRPVNLADYNQATPNVLQFRSREESEECSSRSESKRSKKKKKEKRSSKHKRSQRSKRSSSRSKSKLRSRRHRTRSRDRSRDRKDRKHRV